MAEFTDTQKESIREVIDVGTSSADTSTLNDALAALNEAQKTATLADLVAWNKIKYGTVKSKGGIKGTNYDMERDQLQITNRVRRRLNYKLLAGSINSDELGIAVYRGISPSGSC